MLPVGVVTPGKNKNDISSWVSLLERPGGNSCLFYFFFISEQTTDKQKENDLILVHRSCITEMEKKSN